MQNLQDIRIASLVPSLTELVVELGLESHLVARTGFCIHPAPQLREVPKVGGTKDVNLAKLRQLAPTHVLVNVDENRADIVPALQAMGAEVVVTQPNGPEDNLSLIDQLVQAFGHLPGVAERAVRLDRALRDELVHSRAFASSPQHVLYLIWHGPWMTVARDTYISRMLATVGWSTLPAVEGGAHGAARYPVVRGDEPWLTSVQRVLLSSEPFRFDDAHVREAQALCPQAIVQRVDGELVSWYGPRAVPGLRYLRALAAA
ncbi:helical backbone metal receptor [Piscinibacter gummiphilus]|uniref:Helical backbone metal receptor n=1 Tax=Piscinibacter gummiphilus TaxID=946333 RepID=A0ABZ0CTX0_9BURK|nr:helical backbone metal receptor [Piscinibacter gummiphilus]WOB08431.1 helical backbone metal receptor [Piscinibacter gummiphilus]